MEIKRFFIRIMPNKQQIQNHTYLRVFSNILRDPEIFHLTRHSAAGGVAFGLFIAFLPIPGHIILAFIVSILFRVNLPLCFLLVWISNPLTAAPIYYLNYKLGAILLGTPVQAMKFEMTWAWFGGRFIEIWPALLTGSLVISFVSSIVGYSLVRMLWRLAVVRKWKTRTLRGSNPNQNDN